jgi:hypothetical protein
LVSKQSLEPEVKDQILEELIEEMLLGLPEGPEFAAFSKEAIAALSNIVSMVQLAIAERTVPSEHARKVLRSIKSNDTDLAKRRTMVAGLLEGIASSKVIDRCAEKSGVQPEQFRAVIACSVMEATFAFEADKKRALPAIVAALGAMGNKRGRGNKAAIKKPEALAAVLAEFGQTVAATTARRARSRGAVQK